MRRSFAKRICVYQIFRDLQWSNIQACLLIVLALTGCSPSFQTQSTTITKDDGQNDRANAFTTTETATKKPDKQFPPESTIKPVQITNKFATNSSGELYFSMQCPKGASVTANNFQVPGCENLINSAEFIRTTKMGGRVTVYSEAGITRQICVIGKIAFVKGKPVSAEPGSEVYLTEISRQGTRKAKFVEQDRKVVIDNPKNVSWAWNALYMAQIDDRSPEEITTDLVISQPKFDKALDDNSNSFGKVRLLKALAAQPSLSPEQQLRVVDEIFNHMSFSGDQAEALCSLAKNRALTKESRKLIGKNIDKITFSGDRERVLKILAVGE